MSEKFVVVKGGLNTANRRIAEGEYVTREEIEAGDRDFDALRAAGRIVHADTKAAEKAAVHAKEAEGLILAATLAPVPAPIVEPPAPEPDQPAKPKLKRPSRRRPVI